MRPLYTILFPAYNEEQALEHAVHEAQAVFLGIGKTFEIVIVDDGSTDATQRIGRGLARKMSTVRYVRHKSNQGKGAAVQTGVRQAKGEWLLFLDVDLATHPRDIASALPLMKKTQCFIGSRRHEDSTIDVPQPWYRVLFGRLVNLVLVRCVLRLPFTDTQCGFKLVHRSLFWAFDAMQTHRWMFDAELLARLHWRGVKIQEVPVHWRHGRESRVKLKDVGSVLRETWSIYKQKPR